jgi:murein L,D-transpeptidase YafK
VKTFFHLRFLSALFFILALVVSSECLAQEEYLPDALLYPGNEAGVILVVDKTRQEMRIYRHDGKGNVFLEKIIPCSTGMIQGDKLARGDKKTPDGYYIFNQKLLPRELPEIYGILAYPMDYPNFWDKRQGRGGDGIWTHGINKPLVDFDSYGCVELFNHDIAALEQYISLYETPIVIYENLNVLPISDLKREGARVLSFVESWRRAWSQKDMETYRGLYSPKEFVNTDNLTFEGWMRHKANIANLYKKIEINVDNLRVFRHRDVIVVSFDQRYQGDRRYSSTGGKRLYLRENGDSFQIVGEEFVGGPQNYPDKWLSAEERQMAISTPPLSVAAQAVPVAAASAGAILPGGSVLTALNTQTQTDQSEILSEETRINIAARARNPQNKATTPQVSDDSPGLEDVKDEVTTPTLTAESGITPTFSSSTREQVIEPKDLKAAPVAAPVPASELASSQPRLQVKINTGPKELEPSPGLAVVNVASRDSSLGVGASAQGTSPTPRAPTTPPTPTVIATQVAQGAPSQQPAQTSEEEAQAASQAAGAPEEAVVEVASLNPKANTPEPNKDDSESEILKLLNNWEKSWENKDLESYFALYADDFRFREKGMDLAAYKEYRSANIKKAGKISVSAEKAQVTMEGDKATLTFTQRYKADNYQDRGQKTLSLKLEGGAWKITGETFKKGS